MAEAAYFLGARVQSSEVLDSPRHSALVRITHWIFTLSFFGLVVSGFGIILAHPHFYWGETGSIGTPSLFDLPLRTRIGGPSGWGRSMHFQSAWFAVLSGLLYAISGILTQHFRKQLLPRRKDLSWHSMRAAVLDHVRFKRPVETDSYNFLQRLSYLAVVFLFFPLIIITGLAMSPAITSVVPQMVTVFGGYRDRTHPALLPGELSGSLSYGACRHGDPGRVQDPDAGHDHRPPSRFAKGGLMSNPVSRRKLITAGFAAAAGVSGLAVASNIASRYGLIPPDHGGICGVGETLTYAAQRLLMSHHSLAREFKRSEISKVVPVSGESSRDRTLRTTAGGGFADWRLTVDGLVARPSSFSLAELKGRFAPRSPIRPAKKAGPSSPNGPACRSPIF